MTFDEWFNANKAKIIADIARGEESVFEVVRTYSLKAYEEGYYEGISAGYYEGSREGNY